MFDSPSRPGSRLDLPMARYDALISFNEADRQNLFRCDLPHWEVAKLFRLTMQLAIFDALRADGFDAFREQWIPLVGQGEDSDALDWLPAIYLGAVASPLIVPESRRVLVDSALAWL